MIFAVGTTESDWQQAKGKRDVSPAVHLVRFPVKRHGMQTRIISSSGHLALKQRCV